MATRIALDTGGAAPRTPGKIVAKGTARVVHRIAAVGDELVIAHHEDLAIGPGGITVRRRADFAVSRSVTGLHGRLDVTAAPWLAAGPLWRGRDAALRLVDPATLAVVDRFPLCAPFVRRDADRIIAHTPVEADPAELAAGRLDVPAGLALVELHLEDRTVRPLVAAREHDPFTRCALHADMLYAVSGFGRIVAVDVATGRLRWERPPVRTVMELSVHALAVDPTGARLAIGGSSAEGNDLLVLDAARGEVERSLAVCPLLDRAGVGKRNARIEVLAFHPAGWLAIATSGGAVAELSAGQLTAFRAATAGIEALAFLDDGATLIVGGREPDLRIWPVDL